MIRYFRVTCKDSPEKLTFGRQSAKRQVVMMITNMIILIIKYYDDYDYYDLRSSKCRTSGLHTGSPLWLADSVQKERVSFIILSSIHRHHEEDINIYDWDDDCGGDNSGDDDDDYEPGHHHCAAKESVGEEEGRSKMSPTRTLPFLSVSPEAVKSCSARCLDLLFL